jgi:hypothetical protein
MVIVGACMLISEIIKWIYQIIKWIYQKISSKKFVEEKTTSVKPQLTLSVPPLPLEYTKKYNVCDVNKLNNEIPMKKYGCIIIYKDGKNSHPMTLEQVFCNIQLKKLSETDWAWTDGFANWMPLKNLLLAVPYKSKYEELNNS